jgi:uncharacterized membrane protein
MRRQTLAWFIQPALPQTTNAAAAPFNLTFGEFTMITKTQSGSLAFAAALFALSAVASAATAPAGSSGAAISAGDKVHCYGVHECKGNSDCKTSENGCKAQNACKGHGFKGVTAKACFDAGGTIGDVVAK